MLATIPSPHVYFLPTTSASWTFIWIIINHPYLVGRLQELLTRSGPVLHAPAGTDLPEAMAALLRNSSARRAEDDAFSREGKLFDLIVAANRAAHVMQHKGDERDRLMAKVRQMIRSANMARPNVQEIASAFDMSRSNFSHHFRATTGLTPAAFVRELRLERARDEVVGTDRTFKAIALTLGFADANHFGKVFRARFNMTPVSMRAQIRGRWKGRS